MYINSCDIDLVVPELRPVLSDALWRIDSRHLLCCQSDSVIQRAFNLYYQATRGLRYIVA